MIIFLIGLRGSGKTTVGPLLAQRLALPFFDADAELEAKHGATIREIFARHGEPTFREFEELLLAELIARGPAVIATGGGVVLREANRRRMKSAGKVFWLHADAATLWQRLQADPLTAQRRPNLAGGGHIELEETLQIREPFYRSCADAVFPAQDRSPEQIVADMVALCSTSTSNTAR